VNVNPTGNGGLITAKLNAINSCLAGVGLSPVSSEDDPDLDAAQAEQTIDRISKEIQQRGWFFNKEYNWNIAPDSNTGQIVAPAKTLSLVTEGASRDLQLSLREGRLYDMVNHTFDLSDLANYEVGGVLTIQLAFIIELDFNDLPPVAQTAITYTARRQFAQDLEVDERRWKFQKQDEVDAMNLLQREEMRNRKHNYLRDNAAMQTFMSRVGGYNSVTRRLSYFPRRNTYY
jgi:hypothetical protein